MIECSANEFHHALLIMKEEVDQFPGPIKMEPFIEEAIKEILGWTPAMWIKLGMTIQKEREDG
jgi:hypothetical protein